MTTIEDSSNIAYDLRDSEYELINDKYYKASTPCNGPAAPLSNPTNTFSKIKDELEDGEIKDDLEDCEIKDDLEDGEIKDDLEDGEIVYI
jgi:hypothetical protein